MATLYELSADLMALLEMASEPDVDEEILKDTIEAVEGEIEIKADGYAKVMKELDGQTASLKAEIDRLTARKKSIENSKERIKKALEEAMKATGKTKFKTELFSFGIQKNPPSLRVAEDFDVNEAPAEYLTFEAPKLNKKALLDAIKNGEEFSFCTMEQTEGLRIR